MSAKNFIIAFILNRIHMIANTEMLFQQSSLQEVIPFQIIAVASS